MAHVATRHHERPAGLVHWLTTTNHKDIGTLYLLFALAMFLAGGAMALVIRAELFQPGLQLVHPHFFNQLTTLHALVMVFGALLPAFAGLANWQIPLMIGAPGMALPRLNGASFWLLPFASALLLAGPFLPGGGPDAGWTLYAPLSVQGGMGTDFAILSIHMMTVSSVLGAINVIATILNMRAAGMTLMRMPLFVWTWLVTAFLLLAAMPVLAGALTMLLTDRHFGTHFFDAAGGGDPVLWQHAFWFFGRPGIYLLILPAFGIVSQLLPAFARKPLFGYRSMVFATVALAFLSFLAWGSHLVTAGLPLTGQLFFMYAAMLIAVPAGVQVFSWVATLWRGALSFETPMLFAVAFLLLFTLGGLSGLMLAVAPTDFQYHDTYFVTAHLHYALVAGALFAVLGGAYYWLPKWTGHRYDERLGRWHFWLSAIGVNVAFLPQFFLGLAGMPRRIPDYALRFVEFNRISTIGAFVFGLAQLLFVYIVWRTVRGGAGAGDKPWEGAEGLEWTLPSPPPYHSCTAAPKTK